MLLFIIIACIFFCLMGLLQWARGGAGIWSIFDFSQKADVSEIELKTKTGTRLRWADREKKAKRSLELMKSRTDRILKSSLKTLGVLGGIMWLFIAVVSVSDVLGIDLLDQLGFRATRYWSTSGTHTHSSSARSVQNNSLKQIRNNISVRR